MINNNFENFSNQDEESFNIKSIISYYAFFWPWFLLTLLISLISSYIYIRYSPNIYQSFAQIQIKKSDASSSFLASEVTSLFGTRINVENDISVIKSNHILSKVVKKLDLQTTVSQIGRVKSNLKFKNNLPFEIIFKDSNLPQQWNLTISDQSAHISNNLHDFNLNKNQAIENDFFNFKIIDSSFVGSRDYLITRSTLNNATLSLQSRLKAKSSTVK